MKTLTLVYGFYSNPSMLVRETYTDRATCWARVQELMNETIKHWDVSGQVDRPVCVLEVNKDLGNGRTECTEFKRYEPGCKYEKWITKTGSWGCSKAVWRSI